MDFIFSIFQVVKGIDYSHKPEKCKTLLELIGEGFSAENINFMPGTHTSACYKEAIFVSLTKQPPKANLSLDQLIPLKVILPILFKQVLVDCLDINRKVSLIVDDFEMSTFEKWNSHFELIKNIGIDFQIYYIGGSNLKNITTII